MKKIFLSIVLAVFFSTGVFAAEGPTDQLRPTLDQLIKILSDASLKGDAKKVERREKIMAVVSGRFDFKEMSKRVLGKTWSEITPEQQAHFTTLMTKLLENNYIGQLEGYSGETVEYTGERVKDGRAQVSTLVENNGSKFPVHYILLQEGTNWVVYDVNIEGVSLIRNYRAEFSSILRKDGYDGLVKTIEEKNKSLE